MGEVAEQVGRFVTAYSGDLQDESLDGQRVVVGGIVTGVRTVITKAQGDDGDRRPSRTSRARSRSSSSRGCTSRRRPTWREGAILLVAGPRRPQGRGGRRSSPTSSWTGTTPRRCGPEAFAREVAAGDRGGGRAVAAANGAPGRRRGNGNGAPVPGRWSRSGPVRRRSRSSPAPAVGEPPAVAVRLAAPHGRRGWRHRRPSRSRRCRRSRLPNRSRPTSRPTASRRSRPTATEEPAVPDEARARIVAAATADAPLGCRSRRDPARPLRRHRPPRSAWCRRWSCSSCCSATGRARRAW